MVPVRMCVPCIGSIRGGNMHRHFKKQKINCLERDLRQLLSSPDSRCATWWHTKVDSPNLPFHQEHANPYDRTTIRRYHLASHLSHNHHTISSTSPMSKVAVMVGRLFRRNRSVRGRSALSLAAVTLQYHQAPSSVYSCSFLLRTNNSRSGSRVLALAWVTNLSYVIAIQ
jgi:hypothetical protein